MAEIKKRGSKWQYRVFYTDPATGKQKSKSKSGFDKKADALAAARQLEVDQEHGNVLEKQNVTFAGYYEQWIKDTKLGHYSYGSENRYKNTLSLIKQNFPGVLLKDVSRRTYTKFLDNYAANHSRNSVQKVNTFIRSAVKDAISERIIYFDFTSGVRINGQPGKRESDKYLDESQFKRLIAETQKHLTLNAITAFEIYFAAYTGARLEEVSALTWDRVDFEKNEVTFDRAYDYSLSTGFKPMKTASSMRTIDIPQNLVTVLRHLKKMRDEDDILTGFRNKIGLVFRERNGKVPSNGAVNKSLRRYERAAGIDTTDQITFHGLRHTHASYLLGHGVQISYISKRLGHANIEMTLRVYSHLLAETYAKEAAKATSLLDLLDTKSV